MRRPRTPVPLLAGVAIALVALGTILGRSRPIPEVVLPPIYVPSPIPENCGFAFGEVVCYAPRIAELKKERKR